jgi:hypothetical protein
MIKGFEHTAQYHSFLLLYLGKYNVVLYFTFFARVTLLDNALVEVVREAVRLRGWKPNAEFSTYTGMKYFFSM